MDKMQNKSNNDQAVNLALKSDYINLLDEAHEIGK